MKIKLINGGKAPERIKGDGFDLYTNEDVVIPPRTKLIVKTGVCIGFPKGIYGQVVGRSGISSKTFLEVITGTIDNSYTGEIGIILKNTSDTKSYEIKRYDRLAQLILLSQIDVDIELVEELEETERGGNGFGSTGG